MAADRPAHFEEAALAISRAAAIDPDSASVHLRRGDLASLRDRDWHTALEAFENAAAADPH